MDPSFQRILTKVWLSKIRMISRPLALYPMRFRASLELPEITERFTGEGLLSVPFRNKQKTFSLWELCDLCENTLIFASFATLR